MNPARVCKLVKNVKRDQQYTEGVAESTCEHKGRRHYPGHKPLQQPEAGREPTCECKGRRPFTWLARVKRPKEATRGQKSILKTTTSKRLHNPPTHLKPVKCSDIASRCHQRPNRRQQKPNAAQAALCLWPRALARTNHETRTHSANPQTAKQPHRHHNIEKLVHKL